MDKSVEFSYEELAKATNDFSIDNKIGQGGFGSVYYAELRGEVCCSSTLFNFDSKIKIIQNYTLLLCRKQQQRKWICKHQKSFLLN